MSNRAILGITIGVAVVVVGAIVSVALRKPFSLTGPGPTPTRTEIILNSPSPFGTTSSQASADTYSDLEVDISGLGEGEADLVELSSDETTSDINESVQASTF
ncbi:MAG: hypothetical protein HY459_03090 [Parcubacteria group bacterium]|nr:hypothetical protein [Parcubacteria group bacterium]